MRANKTSDLTLCRLAVQQQKQWSLLDFELGHPLGKGKFGRVFVARTKAATGSSKPGYIIALKALYKDEIRKEGLELQVRRELEIQMNLRSVGSLGWVATMGGQGRGRLSDKFLFSVLSLSLFYADIRMFFACMVSSMTKEESL